MFVATVNGVLLAGFRHDIGFFLVPDGVQHAAFNFQSEKAVGPIPRSS